MRLLGATVILIAAAGFAIQVFPWPQIAAANAEKTRALEEKIAARKKEQQKQEWAAADAKREQQKQLELDFKNASSDTIRKLVYECKDKIIEKLKIRSSYEFKFTNYSANKLHTLADAAAAFGGKMQRPSTIINDSQYNAVENNVRWIMDKEYPLKTIEFTVEQWQLASVFQCSIDGFRVTSAFEVNQYRFQ